MRTLCFYFQVHQPYRLRWYRFFDIGSEHYYYDDYLNRSVMRKVAENCYLPANRLMLDLIKEHGNKFKIAFSISGNALEQFEQFAPDVLQSFQELAKTGCVEFLSETYTHTLASLTNKDEFVEQVEQHRRKIEHYFGQTPQVFRNSELIYSDLIGETVAEMGYKAMLTEGARHILGWKSPNFLYYNAINPKLKLLLKNSKLSEDLTSRFSDKFWSEYPLTAEKYVYWLNSLDKTESTVNLFLDYETFGEHHKADSGIFEFMKALPHIVLGYTDFKFATPSEVAAIHEPVAVMHVDYPISWADAERDLTSWIGNELQNEALEKVFGLREMVTKIKNEDIIRDWKLLQTSDHFYYMCTKFFADGDAHKYFNPYKSPYDAFINYMNVLSDLALRIKDEIKRIGTQLITEAEILQKIKEYQLEIASLQAKLTSSENLKKENLAIEKTKKEALIIDKTKKEALIIDKTKKEALIIDKTKKEDLIIDKTKKEDDDENESKEKVDKEIKLDKIESKIKKKIKVVDEDKLESSIKHKTSNKKKKKK